MSPPKHHIYADESNWKTKEVSPFASIAAITVDTKEVSIKNIEEKWKKKIKEVWSEEMKFKKVSSIQKIDNVIDLLGYLKPKAKGVRIDVIIWNQNDKLDYHEKQQHNPEDTLAIMYYFLIKEVINKKYPKGLPKELPQLYADQAGQIRESWQETQRIFAREFKRELEDIKKQLPEPNSSSQAYVFIQLADIMAGFARNIRDKDYPEFRKKHEDNPKQKLSNTKEHQHALCYQIEQWLRKNEIHFSTKEGIRERYEYRKQAVNLWYFQPSCYFQQSEQKSIFEIPQNLNENISNQRAEKEQPKTEPIPKKSTSTSDTSTEQKKTSRLPLFPDAPEPSEKPPKSSEKPSPGKEFGFI